jgi:hypothetical protein
LTSWEGEACLDMAGYSTSVQKVLRSSFAKHHTTILVPLMYHLLAFIITGHAKIQNSTLGTDTALRVLQISDFTESPNILQLLLMRQLVMV